MCVTTSPARISNTMVYTMVTQQLRGGQPVHVTAYQSNVSSIGSGPNCMIIHYPSQGELSLVNDADQFIGAMDTVCWSLPALDSDHIEVRGGVNIKHYGDYHVVLAESPTGMLSALSQVPEERRPAINDQLDDMLRWYGEDHQNNGLALACFSGTVLPSHPIVVAYVPDNDDIVVAPGLVAYNGAVPDLDDEASRDICVAFGLAGTDLPIRNRTFGNVSAPWWLPTTVTGFHDNRAHGANRDYAIAIEDLMLGETGPELFARCF